MVPTILVLADASATAGRAARYAATLGAPLHAHTVLLNLLIPSTYPVLLTPELAEMEAWEADQQRSVRLDGLWSIAGQLPSSAVVEEAVGPMSEAVAGAVWRHQPLLLALGLKAEYGLLDRLLHNQLLPVLRATHLPLLLVPEAAPPPALPQRVLIALDAAPFMPNRASRLLAPLLAACPATYTVAHVAKEGESFESDKQLIQAEVRASLPLPEGRPVALHQMVHRPPTEGILQACLDTRADLVVLIARTRSFMDRLFRRSVTTQVISRSQRPVLLLPTEEPEEPSP